jgi:hypothetical protein
MDDVMGTRHRTKTKKKKNTTQKNTKNETINPCTRDGYAVP